MSAQREPSEAQSAPGARSPAPGGGGGGGGGLGRLLEPRGLFVFGALAPQAVLRDKEFLGAL